MPDSQTRMIDQFETMSEHYGFKVLDAGLPVERLSEQLKLLMMPLLP